MKEKQPSSEQSWVHPLPPGAVLTPCCLRPDLPLEKHK